MNAAHLMTQTGTVTRVSVAPSGTDEYGNPLLVETTFTVRYELQQATRSENTVDSDQQAEDWNLYLAPTATASSGATVETEVDGSDRFTAADAVVFEVIGPPWPARNPRTGALIHVEARVRRVV